MSAGPRIGLVGHGWWCRHYLLPALRRAGAQVPALCGRDEDRARAAARDLDVPAGYGDVDAMLDAQPLDGVLITAPPSAHAGAVVAAAKRGLAVFCEKPLARTAAESARMLDACAGVPTMVGFTRRWDPALMTARRLLDEGAVGRVRHLRYQTASVMAGDATGEWTWRYDADEYPYGVLSDLGPHALDLVRWLAGEPTAVGAEATTLFTDRPAPGGGRRPVRNWDDVVVTADLAGGAGGAGAAGGAGGAGAAGGAGGAGAAGG
ncbi:Gfo/Idh/MocA family protein, partial [Virgisporangium aurantiacum]|uniref:Gfo/Idh/MocA family protein n=1 Tax=Virgisporangium aurantiacum TaxID=175570 RepID=UPI001951702B